jgi:hypothetical protein
MTQDEIIEMARHIANTLGTRMCDEHGDTHGEELYAMGIDDIVETIKLVATKEIEACAKVCEELPAPDIYSDTDKSMWDVTCMDCASAIRARGQA